MYTQSEIFELMNKYDFSAKKRYGQNFLIDKNIIKKIVDSGEIQDKNVVEVGPGLGSMTTELIKYSKGVTAFEIDTDMINVLKGELNDEKFKLIEGDFLKQDLAFSEKQVFVSNIPYYITGKILFKLFESQEQFSSAIIMMQSEVAERITAKTSSSNYGKLSVVSQLASDVKILFKVPRTSFSPAPKVESAVIKLDFKNKLDTDLMKFIKECFSKQRKKLTNNISSFSKEKVISILHEMKISDTIRPQQLSPEVIMEIYFKLISK